jgi:hypothetical protein
MGILFTGPPSALVYQEQFVPCQLPAQHVG